MKVIFICLKISCLILLVIIAVIIGEYLGLIKWEIHDSLKYFLSRIIGALVALLLAPPMFILIEKFENKIKNIERE